MSVSSPRPLGPWSAPNLLPSCWSPGDPDFCHSCTADVCMYMSDRGRVDDISLSDPPFPPSSIIVSTVMWL